MKKLLNASDRIRLGLVLAGDFISELYGANGSTNWYYRPWEILNIKNHTYQMTLYRQLRAGEIIKSVNSKGAVVYRMSPIGESKFFRDYPLAKLRNQPWDKKWRMVIYDLPCRLNHKRNLLRSKLIELGFGYYQKSVYVTPLDVLGELSEYIQDHGFTDSVVVFEGNRIFGEDVKRLSERLWSLNNINEEYLELEEKLNFLKSTGRDKKVYTQLWDDFTNIVLKDPFLPNEFLPDNWVGERVKVKMLTVLK